MDYPIRTLQQLRPLLVGLRKRAGLSQAAVAALLGVTQQSYAKIESNPASTSVERLYTILRLLGSEMVLTDQAQQAGERAAEPVAEPSTPPSATMALTKTKKGALSAPPKLLPPSNKTEPW